MLMGEAGIGKTRLLEELARTAAWHGWQVAWGRSQELGLPAPHTPLRQALDAALLEPRLRQLAHGVQPLWLNTVAGLAPRVAEIIEGPEQQPSYVPIVVRVHGHVVDLVGSQAVAVVVHGPRALVG